MKKTSIWLAINSVIAVSTPHLAFAETTQLAPIPVTASKEASQSKTFSKQELENTGNTETGSVLRQVNGVDAIRMGGHGLDPVVRGQTQSQLNILLDGAKIEGGCPNRMDPPTSYSEVSSYDKVTVIKGVNSLEYGAGGTGGTILFEREAPKYNPNKSVSGEISAMKSSIINYDVNAQVQAVGKTGYVVLQGNKKDANNYQDGNGNTVPSSYNSQQGHIDLGWTPNDHHELKLSLEKSNTFDALYPGAKMDAPKTEGNIARLQYKGKKLSNGLTNGQLDAVQIDVYNSTVDHVMNNFDLRTYDPTKKMETLTDTTAKGAKIKLTNLIGKTELDYGLQLQAVNKNAASYNRSAGMMLNKSMYLMWPDANTDQNGVFVQAKTKLSNTQKLVYGARVDQVTAEAKKAKQASDMNMTAYSLYSKYNTYSGKTKINETNWNGLLRYEQSLSKGLSWFADASLTTRTANETERFMATKSGTMFWIGNPDLKPEKHTQVDIGIAQDTHTFSWSANAYYDQVKDYILRDYAKNQTGVTTLTGMDNIYVNKDATLLGAELEGTYRLTPAIDIGGQVSAIQGRNTTDKRNLSNIAPVSGNLNAKYTASNWYAGTRFNFASEQSTVNTEYGEKTTSAWSTVDLFAGYSMNKTLQLQAGVDNAFDHAYYNYLNRTDALTGTSYKVMEPGRNIWARISAKF
ncbi:TonB-dependent receptor domain-containing protein [Hydrogenovibrio kuenenii]|uniref:TonB-dependent receptor domain-containing protein n=1 Tax=Hydrogenovibrio kuenenii TaxID=63658 RepID=UPI0004669CA7|nr:TonB-dependent receptor [Hydrogenovibrio kuenenii]